jgi:hypothetical protein
LERKCGLALAALGASVLAVSGAPPGAPPGGPPAGRPIEFSGPTNDPFSTNLSRLTRKADSLLQFEQNGHGPFEFLRPDSSMQGLPLPPPRYPLVIPTRRAQARWERQKDWMSMTPEELLLGTSTSEEPSHDANRPDKEKRSWSDDAGTGYQPGTLNPNAAKEPERSGARKRWGELDSRDEADLPPDIKETQQELKKLVRDTDPGFFSTAPPVSSGFSDIFGSASQRPSLLDQAARKARLEEYRQMIGAPASPQLSSSPVLNPLDSLADSPRSIVNPGAVNLNSGPWRPPFMQTETDGLHWRFGGLTPALPGLPEDKFTGQSALPSLQPNIQQPQPLHLTPPAPTFVFPKRPFL